MLAPKGKRGGRQRSVLFFRGRERVKGKSHNPEDKTKLSAQDLRRMAVACGKSQSFDSDLLEAGREELCPKPLISLREAKGMVPFIADQVQDFRPRELVHIADAYAAPLHIMFKQTDRLKIPDDLRVPACCALGQAASPQLSLKSLSDEPAAARLRDSSGCEGAEPRALCACCCLRASGFWTPTVVLLLVP